MVPKAIHHQLLGKIQNGQANQVLLKIEWEVKLAVLQVNQADLVLLVQNLQVLFLKEQAEALQGTNQVVQHVHAVEDLENNDRVLSK